MLKQIPLADVTRIVGYALVVIAAMIINLAVWPPLIFSILRW